MNQNAEYYRECNRLLVDLLATIPCVPDVSKTTMVKTEQDEDQGRKTHTYHITILCIIFYIQFSKINLLCTCSQCVVKLTP